MFFIQDVEEANSRTKRCVDDSDGLKIVIGTLESTITERSTELNKCGAERTQLDINLRESESTIEKLKETIVTAEKVNKDLNADIAECNIELLASDSATEECNSKNTELNQTIKDTNEKLSSCQKDRETDEGKIKDLTSKSDCLSRDLHTCQNEKIDLSHKLDACREDEDEETIELQDKIAKLNAAQDLLKQCDSRRTEVEKDLENEKTTVITLNSKITFIQNEWNESNKKYEEQIEIFTGNWKQCKGDLQSETDEKNRLTIQITSIQLELNVTIKVRNVYCHDFQIFSNLTFYSRITTKLRQE